MAYTKIHAIKTTVHKSIAYICNPAKTDESILISSFGCSPETAQYDFKFSLSKTRESDENKAFHLIQSFAPGEASYEEAHRIGVELADRLLEGKYSYIVTTHIDKDHVHNHIIFCAADNVNHRKYHDCKRSYYHIRQLSDELCKEHGLSIIVPGKQRGKKYNEWFADKNGTSWKTKLRNDINAAIKASFSYEDFLLLMKAKGYEIKGSEIGENAPKYISFRPLDKERFVRGSAKSLGEEYTKERIKERIENREHKRIPSLRKDYAKKKLIDTSAEKFEQSPGLKHWATIENLKIAAASYNQAGSIAELEEKIASKSALAKSARSSVVGVEHRMKDLAEIIKYAEQYTETRPYNMRYKKAKDQDAFLRKYETQIILYGGAKTMLKRHGIDPAKMNLDELKQEYARLSKQKSELQTAYKTAEKEVQELSQTLTNLNQYLGRETAHNASEPKQNKKPQQGIEWKNM